MGASPASAPDATTPKGEPMNLTISDLAAAMASYVPPQEIGRHELSNEAWALVRDALPRPKTRRGLPRDQRQLLNGMLWCLRTGAPWRRAGPVPLPG